ncbi:MAG: S1-like domain-containing RNA-binding protein [Acholeplasmataceae bacterium]
MSIKIGETQQLIVDRKTDIGYMLTSEQDEVFLHFNESLHQTLNPGDLVDAFLYLDHKGRVAATLKIPFISVERPAFLEVKDVVSSLGVFLDMGISKDVLLSKDDLPFDYDLWPMVGDMIYVVLHIKGKMVAKLASKSDIILKPEETLNVKDELDCYVQNIGKNGLNLLSEEGHLVFVHQSMYQGKYRLGQKVHVTITYISEKGINGSLIEQKEVKIFDDANIILSYLIRHGDLDLDSDSSPEAIKEIFDMSKKAFKRALGHLYKERKIIFVDGKTKLVK